MSSIPSHLRVIVINDCAQDSNGRARLTLHTRTCLELAGCTVASLDVIAESNSYSAGFTVADLVALASQLSSNDLTTVILGNVAPREKNTTVNGCHFGWWRNQNCLVVATTAGGMFAGLRALCGEATQVNVAVTNEVVSYLAPNVEEQTRLATTQFRSLYFQPRLAGYVLQELRGEKPPLPVEDWVVPDPNGSIAHVDAFGNVKLYLNAQTFRQKNNPEPGQQFNVSRPGWCQRTAMWREHLSDIRTGELGLIPGSSGWAHAPFLELVIKGGRAADSLSSAPDSVVSGGETIIVEAMT